MTLDQYTQNVARSQQQPPTPPPKTAASVVREFVIPVVRQSLLPPAPGGVLCLVSQNTLPAILSVSQAGYVLPGETGTNRVIPQLQSLAGCFAIRRQEVSACCRLTRCPRFWNVVVVSGNDPCVQCKRGENKSYRSSTSSSRSACIHVGSL
ncbi:hypothetical protein LY78DRAFT_88802 [Colletotrichum sublineola]|nr:hypothetical protein LY78DRAFT_88802 [Colletotrichum sublineola]